MKVLVLSGLLCASSGWNARPTPDGGLLGGPEIPREAVERIGGEDGQGRFVRVEGRPEFAAARVLRIPQAVREQIRQIERDRSVRLTAHLIDELDLFRAMSDAVVAGDNARAEGMMDELWSRLEDGKPAAPCADDIEASLPAELRVVYRRVIDSYWHRWAQSESREMEPDATRERLATLLFREEVRQAYDGSLRHYRQAMDAIFAATDPTEAQRARIRDRVINHIKRTRLEATPAHRRDVMLEIYGLLDDDRRVRFVEYILRAAIPEA
ncbi:MAG: hypothetical protein AAGA55_04755 [Planctomycetota bacterium]